MTSDGKVEITIIFPKNRYNLSKDAEEAALHRGICLQLGARFGRQHFTSEMYSVEKIQEFGDEVMVNIYVHQWPEVVSIDDEGELRPIDHVDNVWDTGWMDEKS